ncbi:hypothetical protein [Oribacterium sinus]|uniref:hypothetical protein n=1 Tax=Oribacterium sinus TaxID=237576 RepID=UPI0028E4137C|nr:hypothetical protein [Oribacterium sinus]
MKKTMCFLATLFFIMTYGISAFASKNISMPDGSKASAMRRAEYIYGNNELKIKKELVSIGGEQLTLEELAKDYLEFIEDEKSKTANSSQLRMAPVAPDYLNTYIYEQIRKGRIPNTEKAKRDLRNSLVRSMFFYLGNVASVQYKLAGKLLSHSATKNPSNLSFSSTSYEAKQIMNSREYKTIIDRARNNVKNKRISTYNFSDSITLNSTTDLHLALNRVDYSVKCNKRRNSKYWDVEITIKDKYNFEYWAWKRSSSSSYSTYINNVGYYMQERDILTPYYVTITTKDSFHE